MAPLKDYSSLRKRKVQLRFYLLLVFFTSSLLLISANNEEVVEQEAQKRFEFFGRRALQLENEDNSNSNNNKKPTTIKKKLASSLSTKNQTKLAAKTSNSSSSSLSSSKNQTTKLSEKNGNKEGGSSKIIIKLPSDSLKNKTKIKTKSTSDSISNEKPASKSQLKKLNSTSKPSSFPKNSTLLPKKSSDLRSNNKTGKATKKDLGSSIITTTAESESKSKTKTKNTTVAKDQSQTKKPKSEKPNIPSWVDPDDDENDEDDLVSGFRDLPSKFQESLFPDLERISKTSQVYLNKANKRITKEFKPIVGNKYAPTIASIVSCAFILIPLLLVSLIVNRIKAYFSLQKILIFIQIYLSIYFSILCLSSLATGLEPLRFFYATSQSTYVGLQVLQTLAYVLYLLLLLMYLILVFSTETGILTKLLGLGQTFVGFIVGLHYYMMVFHRAVLHQPPKTSWKVHAIYATCFLSISLLTRADRRKKAYFGGEEGKLS